MITGWEWPGIRHWVIVVFEANYDTAEDRKMPDGYKKYDTTHK